MPLPEMRLRAGGRAADQGARGVVDQHPLARIAHDRRARSVEADDVPLDHCAGRPGTADVDSVTRIARDHVPLAGLSAADQVIRRQADDPGAVRNRRGPIEIDADIVLLDGLCTRAAQNNPSPAEMGDHQALDGLAAAVQSQTIGAGDCGPVDLDHRRPGVTGIGRPVDQDLADQSGKGAVHHVDRVGARAELGQVKIDRLRLTRCVGDLDGLAQRDGAGRNVVTERVDRDRQQRALFEPFQQHATGPRGPRAPAPRRPLTEPDRRPFCSLIVPPPRSVGSLTTVRPASPPLVHACMVTASVPQRATPHEDSRAGAFSQIKGDR